MKLSILMPVYNERATLAAAVRRVLAVSFPCEYELVIVDDGSTDGTRELYPAFAADSRVIVHLHDRNHGKGAAISTGASLATGDYVVCCDAGLEYDPQDILSLLAAVVARDVEVVYGTRAFGGHESYSLLYALGNKGVTTFANVLFNRYITDLSTGFKLMPAALLRELDVQENGFGVEAEITAKLLKRGVRPYEVSISYRARSSAAGTKLTWRDGVDAVRILTQIRLAA